MSFRAIGRNLRRYANGLCRLYKISLSYLVRNDNEVNLCLIPVIIYIQVIIIRFKVEQAVEHILESEAVV